MNIKDKSINWIKNWIEENGDKDSKVLIGISGGKDSTITASLCVEALGKERVIGILMPNAVQNDIEDSLKVVHYLGIEYKEINIAELYLAVAANIQESFNQKINSNFKTNTPSRIRTLMLYSIAAVLGNCFVCNTSNFSERFIGWETYNGDDIGDFSPLGFLTKTEVVQLGEMLNLPKELIYKEPNDGMCGISDEKKFGFSYEELDNFILKQIEGPNVEKIRELHNKSHYKRANIQIPSFQPFLNNFSD